MKNKFVRSFLFVFSIGFSLFTCPVISSAGITISPISMTANTPGIDVTSMKIENWSVQTELTPKQLEGLGLELGIMNDSMINKLSALGDDGQSRKLIDFLDSMIQFRSERSSQSNATFDQPSHEPWRTLSKASTVYNFIQESVIIGRFDNTWESNLRNSLADAALDGNADPQVAARNIVRAKLFEARQSAVRRARSYRQLADIIRREAENRELVKNIAMVVEISAGPKQPTISPRSEVTFECTSEPSTKKPSTLIFMQRKRDCKESNVCSIESIAKVSMGEDYEYIYNKLKSFGSAYLDTCNLMTRMLIDSTDVTRDIPGNFASYVGKVTPPNVSIWDVEVDVDPQTGKYSTKGSIFGIGDPVHEILTVKALVDSGLAKVGARSKDPDVVQFIRGVFWNDDPCAQLFAENQFMPLDPSFGVAWYLDFSTAGKDKNPTKDFKYLSCPLLGRSHFGDLQFLHGMADHDGVKPTETANRLLGWANVMYRVAIGEIDVSGPLSDDSTAKTLLGEISSQSPMSLLRSSSKQETRERALGSLLHMIQDTYAHGHVKRLKISDNEDGSIVMFLSYINQKSSKHAVDDKWRNGNTDLERTLAIPGAWQALKACTKIAELYKTKAAWVDVETYLKDGPLLVSEKAVDSGPGEYK